MKTFNTSKNSNPLSKEEMISLLDILSDGYDPIHIQKILMEEYKELQNLTQD